MLELVERRNLDPFIDTYGAEPRQYYRNARNHVDQQYLKSLEEVESRIGNLPTLPRMDIQPILGIIDAITWDTLDDQAWREIVEGVVDRVVVEGPGGDGRTFPYSQMACTTAWMFSEGAAS